MQELFENYLSELIPYLTQETTEEIYINPDGSVRCMQTSGRTILPLQIDPRRIRLFIYAAAALEENEVNPEAPAVSAAGEAFGIMTRIQGFLSPITRGPSLIIRLARRYRVTIQDYINSGFMDEKTANTLTNVIAHRVNLIIAGGTGTGKTTLLNALLELIPPTERLVILEDTDEVQIPKGRDALKLLTTATLRMRDLVRHSLRATPDRIIVGEVRDEAARDLLEAWTTGHPGGLGTVHGETAEKALQRMARLARDGTIGGAPQEPFVAEAIGAIVMISGRGKMRKVHPPLRIEGYQNRFVLSPW